MTIGDQSAEAAALFEKFVLANTCQSILSVFQQLCDCLVIHPVEEEWFYQTLKTKLTHWKAVSLWNRLDKRFNHKEYSGHKACTNTRVLIIGGGPCGLRSAIECKLLGARVVVVEKRDRFSRNNVLHLWPFVIHDLKALGAKVFYPKFCAGSIDHISIRQLQCVLMKISLLLGVEVYTNVGYEDLLEPSPLPTGVTGEAEQKGWRARVSPADHPVSCYDFDVLIGADGKRNTLQGFSRKEFRGKLAIAITANFINNQTTEELRVEEISGVAFIFNQKFFKDLTAQTGIDLENIVYYKDDTHYFVMTAKKHSLLEKGVLLKDQRDTVKLLSRDNVNQQALQNYAREAADVSTNHKLPNLEFAHNHFGQPDIAMFDFTSLFAADTSSRAIERFGRKLLINIVGDSLLEPFWPTGSGCARGFLACFDAAWAVKSWASGSVSPLQVLAERESVYMLLSQTTPESLSKSFNSYTINPITRYKHCNTQALKCIQVRGLYDTTEIINIDDLDPVEIPSKRARTYDIMVDQDRLMRWCNKKLALLPAHLRCEVTDLTTSWKDGRMFCLLMHLYSPDSLSAENLSELSDTERLTNAFNVAESQWGILPMLSPDEILSSELPDRLFMVSYISQFYSSLKDKRPIGASPEFLAPPQKQKSTLSPSAAKISSLRKLGKIIGSGGKTSRRRKSSSGQKSPRERAGSRDEELKSSGSSKSPTHPSEPSLLSPAAGSGRKSPRHSHKLSFKNGPSSPKHKSSHKQGKLDEGAFDVFKVPADTRKESKKEQKVPSTDTVRSRMKDIRDAFSLKSKRQKSSQPAPKKKTKGDWVAGKYEKLEKFDESFQQISRRMEPGNLGNTNPGKRGSNLVSEVASMFEKATPEPSPVLQRRSKLADTEATAGLEALLNREPNSSEICFFCGRRIYLVERQSAEGKYFHRTCFRCYFCDTSLHIGSYTLHRTSLGQAQFYCDQHVGMERLATAKRASDVLDNSRPASLALTEPHFKQEGDSGKAAHLVLERIEFENSIDLAEEETEELQTQHNLGTLSPAASASAHQNNWPSDSDSSSDSDPDSDMDVDEEEEEEVILSVEDVLDEASWRRRQRLHKRSSNTSESTLTSVTTATSSSTDSTQQRLSQSRSVTPPQSLHLLSTTTSGLLPGASSTQQKPVSILKQPINIGSKAANQKSALGNKLSTRSSQSGPGTSPTSHSSSMQEINRRKSNFFAQQSEAVKLDPKAVLDPHPSSQPPQNLTAVNISLGDTLQFKRDKGLINQIADSSKPSNQGGEDVVTSQGEKSLTHHQNIPADTFTRKGRIPVDREKEETTPKSLLRQSSSESDDEDHPYDNFDNLVAAGVTVPTQFITRRKPKTPIIKMAKDEELEEDSDSDTSSESSFEVSTPSDSELESMESTLGPDGRLSPCKTAAAAATCRLQLSSTPNDNASLSTNEQQFHTPLLRFAPGTRGGSNYSPPSRRAARKSKSSNTALLARFSNPNYEHMSLGNVYGQVSPGMVSPVKVSPDSVGEDNSVYMTPSGAVYHDLENPDSPSNSFPQSTYESSEEVLTPSRRKIPIDESLQLLTFELDSSSSSDSEHLVNIGVDRQSAVELDGSFHKMCISDQLPLASDAEEEDLYSTEEEFSEESSETESSEDSDSEWEKVSVPGAKISSPEKVQRAAARLHKREETKRLRAAQEIQRHLQEVEVKTKAIENEGVELEKFIRGQETSTDVHENKDLMQKWYDVVHNKSQLCRYHSELMVKAKDLELEDRHARLTHQARALFNKPESEKTYEDTLEEGRILEELIQVVEQRDELVNLLEVQRLQERQEDEDLRAIMTRKGFELSPLPFTQVTIKKGYKGRRSKRLLSQ